MILGLQVIALIFALIMIYFAYLHYRRGEINGLEIISWLVVWFGAILLISFPELFRTFSSTIAISRPFDLAVIGGFILLIPIVYISYIKTKRLEKKLEKYVRGDALNNIKDGKKANKST